MTQQMSLSAPVGQRGARRNTLGLLAMVFGILAVVGFWPLAFASVPMGRAGLRRVARGEADNPGQATTGVVCGVISLALVALIGLAILLTRVWGNG